MTVSFTCKYASLTKQTEISSNLEAITIQNVREDDKDDYAALDKLAKRINKLAPMARIKDCDDEENMKFLIKAVSGTKWRLHAKQKIPTGPSFQRLTRALYTSVRKLDTFQQQTTSSPKTMVDAAAGAFRKSSRKRERKDKEDAKSSDEFILSKLSESLSTKQRR